jgi:exonuclease III
MKILTWNINHRIQPKKIPPHMAEALSSLSPDVVVLTEYIQGPTHDRFIGDLKSKGFPYVMLSPFEERRNRILISSRTPMKAGGIMGPTDIIDAVPFNVLHVVLEKYGVNILGLRMPLPMNAGQKKAWWDWLITMAQEHKDLPFVITGDFNTDPEKSKGSNGINRFEDFRKNGWTYDLPDTYSWWWNNKDEFGWKLDHTLLTSKHFSEPRSAYLTESGPYVFARRKPEAMSDHAVLVVDAEFRN